MLRITTIDTPAERRLVLEGKLVGAWAAELRTAANAARDIGQRALVVDIKNVSAINQEGENVLFELMQSGASIHSTGVFTKHICRELSRKLRARGQEPRP